MDAGCYYFLKKYSLFLPVHVWSGVCVSFFSLFFFLDTSPKNSKDKTKPRAPPNEGRVDLCAYVWVCAFVFHVCGVVRIRASCE